MGVVDTLYLSDWTYGVAFGLCLLGVILAIVNLIGDEPTNWSWAILGVGALGAGTAAVFGWNTKDARKLGRDAKAAVVDVVDVVDGGPPQLERPHAVNQAPLERTTSDPTTLPAFRDPVVNPGPELPRSQTMPLTGLGSVNLDDDEQSQLQRSDDSDRLAGAIPDAPPVLNPAEE